jgi:hypothetical protein
MTKVLLSQAKAAETKDATEGKPASGLDVERERELKMAALQLVVALDSSEAIPADNKTWGAFVSKVKSTRELMSAIEQIKRERAS